MAKRLYFALILMGFTSLIVQSQLIREFLIVFNGNELTIGLILANWIILEAIGSVLSSRPALKVKRGHLTYAVLQAGISLYLPLSIFLIRTVKGAFGLTTGEGAGIIPIIFGSLFIAAPLSLLDGAQFPFGCRMMRDASNRPLESAGRVYILEAIGFILAGPIFTYLLITRFNSFSISFIIGLLNLISASLLLTLPENGVNQGVRPRAPGILRKTAFSIINILIILFVFASFGLSSKMQKVSINKQWRGQKVLSYRNSIYGNLAVTESANQYTFYADGLPVVTTPTPDITSTEELVHFAMLSHANPKKVLLLSGGPGGVINELLKYPITAITYCELDPALIGLIKNFPTELTKSELSDKRLEIKYIDGPRYLLLTMSKYDVVIMNVPIPSTLGLNRFYTREFFRSVKSVLDEDGLFAFRMPGSLSYISPEMRNVNGTILNTLDDVFYVNIIPGDYNLYLASREARNLSQADLLNRLEKSGVETNVLNKPYLEYRLNPRWATWFKDSMRDYTRIRKNYNLLPSGTFYSIFYWNELFSKNLRALFAVLDKLDFKNLLFCLAIIGGTLLALKRLFPKLKRHVVGLAILTTGFSGMSFNLILIYAYQAFYGFVFHHYALLTAAFMSGLTLGGWLMNRRLKKMTDDARAILRIECAIIVFSIFVWSALFLLNGAHSLGFSFLFFILSAGSGFLVGSEFPVANKIYLKTINYSETGGLIYSLDLAGACMASILTSIALVPVIGILNTCLLLGGLKVISLILIASSK
ncbi:MAG: hypothetical protein A2987_00955 [Omnitrophica bacterium RIFCSPLOWO2_01_FULL_45_10]|nr:MAG: hypothetical protein A2987_00955 [Omnitrophica bacterium RIFCSPLOWO2_01_FULL_45_10]